MFDRARTTGVTLSDIAAGIEVVDEQRERGVATVDDTDADLVEALASFEAELPCEAAAAATVLEAFAGGAAVGDAAREAGVVPVTAAKALHRLGVEGVSPLGPTGREVVRDWLSATLSHAEARELTGASEREFALAAYVESHDPIPGGAEVVAGVRANRASAAVEKRDRLAGAMSNVDERR
jgi:hypothetical protein